MFITKRKVKRYTYYYAIQQARVNGKPRIVWQKYLGTAENIIKQRSQLPEDVKERLRTLDWELGSVSALLDIARQLNIVETINRSIGIRFRSISTGDYIALAAINRCVGPCSKSKLGEWYQRTSLMRLLKFKPNLLTSQKFWNHMSLLTKEKIESIENEITQHTIKKYNLDLSCLIYDPTNFFTYIDTFTKSELPQRGRNKQGRSSLRQVNLGLVVTKEFHIPLFHYVYNGNINDVAEFGSVTETLVQRYKILSNSCNNITLVYDKGNNSCDNQETLDRSNYHFVGSLVPTHFKELLEIPLENFKQLACESLEGVKVYRTKTKVFNKERTVLITYNDELFTTQMKTLSNQISKIRCKLKELKKKVNKSKKITRKSLEKQIDRLLSKKHFKDIITVKIETKNKRPMFSYEINRKELHHLTNTLFGKTILFTDQDSWSDEEIIVAYRGQYQIEKTFRQMKDPYFVCWYPQFHWTDQKIRVHAFYCVLALTLVSLLNRELNLKGIKISIPEMLKQLKSIKETLVIRLPRKKRTIELQETNKYLFSNESDLILSATNKIQQDIFETLNLSRFLPS